MKQLFALVLVASSLAGFGAANAAQGCGPGFHRGPYGGCRPNGGVVVVAPRVVERPRGRGGAARPHLPARFQLALWALPSALSAASSPRQNPA